MKFNEILRRKRTEKGLTQKELGDLIGVTPVTIGNWERGIRQPAFDLLPELAYALETTIDSLFGEKSHFIAKRNDATDHLVEKYVALDAHGKHLVDTVCDIEFERIQQKSITRHPKKQKRYLPLYSSPSAAGIAAPLEGNDFEMLLVDDSVPEEADYAVRISGDSMSPYIHDGDTVFVKETQSLSVGDVGIFCVDGSMYCKQYYIDHERNLFLVSANPDRKDTNIFIPYNSSSTISCCGKVLLGRSISFPDYFRFGM